MCLYVYNCVCPCTRVYAFTFVCIGVCVYRYVRACMNRSVTVYTTGMRIFQRVCVYVQLCVYACVLLIFRNLFLLNEGAKRNVCGRLANVEGID